MLYYIMFIINIYINKPPDVQHPASIPVPLLYLRVLFAQAKESPCRCREEAHGVSEKCWVPRLHRGQETHQLERAEARELGTWG